VDFDLPLPNEFSGKYAPEFQDLSGDTQGYDDIISLPFFVTQKRQPSRYDFLTCTANA
jgi:hypothetical protein